MAGLRDILTAASEATDPGGCWRMFGGRDTTSGSYSSPVTLEISGTTASYSVLDILPGGDNPDVTDWLCGFRYVAILYGCTSSVAGCLCPSGECPDSGLYIFDTDGCCCVLPCDGDFTECTYSNDFGITISVPSSSTFTITSLILDGTQYVSTPVTLMAPNLINIGSQVYNTAFSDTINSIGVPNLTSPYPSEAQIISAHAQGSSISMRNNVNRIKRPTCQSFFIAVTDGTNNYTWSDTGFTGPFAGTLYAFTAPIDCVNTNEC